MEYPSSRLFTSPASSWTCSQLLPNTSGIRPASFLGMALMAALLVLGNVRSATAIDLTENTHPAPGPAQPLSQRFTQADVTEIPDFQKHVVPLLSRLGCNGRACHGSFQGQGGFSLSLFGYDFAADHAAITDQSSGRVEPQAPDDSLILMKPLDPEIHDGGKRFEKNSWQHHVLRRWIEAGAPFDQNHHHVLERLEVTPSELIFHDDLDHASLKVIAHWRGGVAEDVTQLCRYQSNDESVATVDSSGNVKQGDQGLTSGDTHVVVFYDNAVIPVPVLRPSTIPVEFTTQRKPKHFIDQLVQRKLHKLGITSSPVCGDEDFIRRVSLDMTGVLPTADRVRRFLSDQDPQKRTELIDELLASPAHAAWWATRFSDWTGNSESQINNLLPVPNVGGKLWHHWIRKRLEENMPYDEIVEGIVTANSRESNESYLEYCQAMTSACQPGGEKRFAQRSGMPLFWGRKDFQKKEQRAIGFAYSFLGVRIECAQCHKHPFDQWSKNDFDQFANLFTPIRMNRGTVQRDSKEQRDQLVSNLTGEPVGKKVNNGLLNKKSAKAIRNGEVVPFGELIIQPARGRPKKRKQVDKQGKPAKRKRVRNVPTGMILGSEQGIKLNQDPRNELMRWLRAPENPYFAKAIVNRVWANYFGIGIVNPSDDLNLANPPGNSELLEALASQFIESGFDLRWLHRTITTSDTYARSSQTNPSNLHDRDDFSHHIPHRLPAEVLYDTIALATASDQKSANLRKKLTGLAIAGGKAPQRNRRDFAMQVFGQSIRESNCDCDRSDDPSLLQSVYLRNDVDIHRNIHDRQGWVWQACQTLGVNGPKPFSGGQRASAQQRLEMLRKRMMQTAKTYSKVKDRPNAKAKDRLRANYEKMMANARKLGSHPPTLDQLSEHPDSWELAGESKEEQGTRPVPPKTLPELIDDVYLRILTRYPSNDEREICLQYVQQSETPAQGLSSMVWALVNTREFILTR